MDLFINVYDCGASGDGATDDTAAIQKAIDMADETGKTVYFPPGKFVCGELFVKPSVYLKADPTWGYRREDAGRSVLIQRDDEQNCILNISFASGCTIDGLSLMGNGKGDCCGICAYGENFNSKEDAYRIERCRVVGFSSHGVHLRRVWCFSMRHNMIGGCKGDGVRILGWDGFILDNWFSGNGGCGYVGVEPNASVTMTGNRIEWNGDCGIYINHGNNYNITGNYIDRSGSAAIKIVNNSYNITCTGNVVYRSGKLEGKGKDSIHCVLEDSKDIVFSTNTMRIGRDDGRVGVLSPKIALRLKGLENSIITGNTLEATEGIIYDCGCHNTVIIKDNAERITDIARE